MIIKKFSKVTLDNHIVRTKNDITCFLIQCFFCNFLFPISVPMLRKIPCNTQKRYFTNNYVKMQMMYRIVTILVFKQR